jgi:GntR family transcriptional regulator
VVGGVLKPGDQLPTVRALAEELRVNFNTVARAYRMLDEARIISTQQGRGTYITEIPPPRVTEKLRKESLEALAQRFISEAMRLEFSKTEISRMVRDQLNAWNNRKKRKANHKGEYKMDSKFIKRTSLKKSKARITCISLASPALFSGCVW